MFCFLVAVLACVVTGSYCGRGGALFLMTLRLLWLIVFICLVLRLYFALLGADVLRSARTIEGILSLVGVIVRSPC